MPIEYDLLNKEGLQLVRNVLQTYHPCLAYAEVRVGAIVAKYYSDSDGPPKPAVKAHGYPALATIQITPVKWRTVKAPDALITLDSAAWDSLDSEERSALIDHELQHLMVKAEKGVMVAVKDLDTDRWNIEGSPSYDCLGRPRLVIRKHDWQLGGFTEVTKRWGKLALEYQAIKHHTQDDGQLVWDWAVDEHQRNRKGSAA